VFGNVTNIPFPNEYFSAVICVDVIEEVNDDAKAAEELMRVLKNDGVLIVHTPNAVQTHILGDFADNPAHIRRGYTDAQLKTLLSKTAADVQIYPTFNVLQAVSWELVNLGRRVDDAMLERLINFDVENYKNLAWLCICRKQ
jgi:ubiquinone/menaquinone biosynthesis C-methylase UbiE